MSALNNPSVEQQETTTTSATLRALKQTMLNPRHAIDERILRQSGVDVDMLYETYNGAVKPYLDYLHGYADLRKLDPHSSSRTHWDESLKTMVTPESWEYHLMRIGVVEPSVDMQTVRVLHRINLWCHTGNDVPPYVQLNVWLTRKGQWVLSYAQMKYNRSLEVISESLHWFESLEDFWATLHELVPDGYRVDYNSGGHDDKPAYLPLFIESHLRRIVEATVDVRQGRLNSMKESIGAAGSRVSNVMFRSR